MIKHTQRIRRQIAEELFECVWPFCEIGAKWVKKQFSLCGTTCTTLTKRRNKSLKYFKSFGKTHNYNYTPNFRNKILSTYLVLNELSVQLTFLQPWTKQSLNPFQSSVAFHTETSHLIGKANQITGFSMKWNTGLKWVNLETFLWKHILLVKVVIYTNPKYLVST